MSENRNTFICNKTNGIFSVFFCYYLLHFSDPESVKQPKQLGPSVALPALCTPVFYTRLSAL